MSLEILFSRYSDHNSSLTNLYVSGTSTLNGKLVTNSDISVNTSLSVPIINNVSRINGSNIYIGDSTSKVYIDGSTNYVSTTNLQVTDKTIVLNKNGVNSNNSGIEVEKNGQIDASIKLTDNSGWIIDTKSNQNGLFVIGKSNFNNQVSINNNL